MAELLPNTNCDGLLVNSVTRHLHSSADERQLRVESTRSHLMKADVRGRHAQASGVGPKADKPQHDFQWPLWPKCGPLNVHHGHLVFFV